MSVSSTATATTLCSTLSDFQPHRPPRSGLRITMPTENSTTLSPDSLETPSCEHSHRSLAHGSTDGLLRTSESSDESFNESSESPPPQTPATPQELQTGRLPTTATVAPPVDGPTRPTAAHIRAKRKPVPSVIDLLGYDPGPMPSHPLTPATPGTPATPFTAGHNGGNRFTIGPLAGMDLPDLDGDQRSSGHSSKYSGITLQGGNPSVLSLPMRVLEVDRPSQEGPRRTPVRRSTFDCYSTYTCNYNSSKPDLSLARSATDGNGDNIIPPPRRQSLYRGSGGKKLSAAKELEELRRMTHYASMDFDTIKRQNRANQSSFLVGDNDSDHSSINSNPDGPVSKRLKKLSLKKKNTTNYTKTSAKLMNTIDEKQQEQPKGWLEWVCDVVPCLHREKVSSTVPGEENKLTRAVLAVAISRTCAPQVGDPGELLHECGTADSQPRSQHPLSHECR